MPTTPPPFDFQYEKGYEIHTKDKEAIRQLYTFGHVSKINLEQRYHLGESTIRKILRYPAPERKRIGRKGRLRLVNKIKIKEIIKWYDESWEHRKMNFRGLREEFNLPCSVTTLGRLLNEQGYYRFNAEQKPFLTADQIKGRFLWAIAHVF